MSGSTTLSTVGDGILDIGGSNIATVRQILEQTLLKEVRKQDNGMTTRCIPAAVMYEDSEGFDLWCDLNKSKEWYHGRMETEMLEQFGDQIASQIPSGSKVFDLGSG